VNFFHKLHDICLVRDIAANGHATDFASHAPCVVRIDIGDDDDLRARSAKFASKSRSATSMAAARVYAAHGLRLFNISTWSCRPMAPPGHVAMPEIVESGQRKFEK